MKWITASALALTMATGTAYADAHTSEMKMIDLDAMQGDLIRTRDITGGNIYTMDPARWTGTVEYDAVDANWVSIGEIEDIVLNRSGQMIGIVAEIGGFLDIGDKHVVIPVENVSLVAVDDRTYSYVTRYSEEELEELPGVDEGFWN